MEAWKLGASGREKVYIDFNDARRANFQKSVKLTSQTECYCSNAV